MDPDPDPHAVDPLLLGMADAHAKVVRPYLCCSQCLTHPHVAIGPHPDANLQ